jgi:glycerophosphoryl diester phosphodiesterase
MRTPPARARLMVVAAVLAATIPIASQIPSAGADSAEFDLQAHRGADGIITDYPTVLRQVMTERGMQLPPAYHCGR